MRARLQIIGAPKIEQARQLIETGHRLTWYETSDGLLLVQVYDDGGNFIDGGAGDNAEEALREVAERLLPRRER